MSIIHDECNFHAHTQAIRDYLYEELSFGRLLQLTHEHADTCQGALDLVIPIVGGDNFTEWSQVGLSGLQPALVVQLATEALLSLERLTEWSADDINHVFQLIAGHAQASPRSAELISSVFILRRVTSLPVAQVLTALGRSVCLSRLQRSLRRYQDMQMVS